jgi:ubiquinone biosynthesis protein UbiJ
MITELDLEERKYTIHHDQESGKMWATRYGESWRELTGDKLIGALLAKIESLEDDVRDLTYTLSEME